MNLLGVWGYRVLGIALAIGLMMFQAGYCPMSAKGNTAGGMAGMPCCQGHDGTQHDQNTGNHRTPCGMCTMACCAAIGVMPGTVGYQVHLAPGQTHVAWTVPQLESWNSGVILRPPRA